MRPRCCRPGCGVPPLPGCRSATSWVHYTTSCNTQSSAPEDERNHRPKHVELLGIINKPLLLHLVGCIYYLYQWCTVKQISNPCTRFWCFKKRPYICRHHWKQLRETSFVKKCWAWKILMNKPLERMGYKPPVKRILFYAKEIEDWPENYRLRVGYTVCFSRNLPAFRRSLLLTFSGQKVGEFRSPETSANLQSVFFWEFPRRLKFKSRRFGTQCRFHRPGRSGIKCVEAR